MTRPDPDCLSELSVAAECRSAVRPRRAAHATATFAPNRGATDDDQCLATTFIHAHCGWLPLPADINNGDGEVHLGVMAPVTSRTGTGSSYVKAWGDATGYEENWSLTAIAICAA